MPRKAKKAKRTRKVHVTCSFVSGIVTVSKAYAKENIFRNINIYTNGDEDCNMITYEKCLSICLS